MKEITLKELLETTFTINEKGEMVGEFTLKRINMICDILTNQYKEIERLKSNEKTLADLLDKEQKKNKKAIEYIEQLPFNDLTPIEVKVIYKILQGDDKE